MTVFSPYLYPSVVERKPKNIKRSFQAGIVFHFPVMAHSTAASLLIITTKRERLPDGAGNKK